jgi:hypothetical protein
MHPASQWVRPAVQSAAQLPLEHTCPASHAVAQVPQWLGSLATLAQTEPQSWVPPPHTVAQLPPSHASPFPHAFPHVPQFALSVDVSAQ